MYKRQVRGADGAPLEQTLDGAWKFFYAQTPGASPQEFYREGYDVSGCNTPSPRWTAASCTTWLKFQQKWKAVLWKYRFISQESITIIQSDRYTRRPPLQVRPVSEGSVPLSIGCIIVETWTLIKNIHIFCQFCARTQVFGPFLPVRTVVSPIFFPDSSNLQASNQR